MCKSDCKFCRNPYNQLVCENDEAELVEMIPFPAIDLTTGETDSHCEPPYWAIRVLWHEEGYSTMEDFIRIKYCPMCGRELR